MRRLIASLAAVAVLAAGLVPLAAAPASATGGTPWSEATSLPFGEWSSVAATGSVAIAVGGWNPGVSATVMRSVDGGTTWTAVTVPGTMTSWTGVATDGASRFVAIGYRLGQGPVAIVSTDGGQNWTAASSLPSISGYWRAISYAGNDTFVAVGDGAMGLTASVMRSTDGGDTWALAADAGSATTAAAWSAVASGGGTLMAVGQEPVTSAPTIMTSTDGGDTWTSATVPPGTMSPTLEAVAYNAGRWLVSGRDPSSQYASVLMTSDDDGQTWTPVVDANVPELVYSLAYGGGVWIGIGANRDSPPDPVIIRSTDNGVTWSQETVPNIAGYQAVAYAVGSWVAIAQYAQGAAGSVKLALTAPGLDPALTPAFDTPVPTQGGFTVNVTNYDSAWTWTTSVDSGATVTAGTASGSTLPLTVTGLQPSSSATVTVNTAKSGHFGGASTLLGTSDAPLPPGIVPNFSNVESLPGSANVWVDNYDPSFTWTVTSTAGTVGAVTASTPYAYWTITGLTGSQTVTVTVSTARAGYGNGSDSTSASAAPSVAAPSLGPAESIAGGFKVEIVDYNASDTYTVSASAGTAARSGRWVTVSGLTAGTSATVTVTRSSTGLTDASSTASGTAAIPGLVPTLDTPVPTANGFTVNVTNHDPAYTWTFDVTSGSVQAGAASGSTLPLTVTGLQSSAYADLLVRTRRTGHTTEDVSVTGNALGAALVPTFEPAVPTADGFTVEVNNAQGAWTANATATNGATVTVGARNGQFLPITVSGLGASTPSTLTVTFTRGGYADGAANITETSLAAGLVPTFGAVTRTIDGFTVSITNHDAAYTWAATATNGATVTLGTPSGSTRLVTVSGLTVGQSTTLTVTTGRTGYADADATVASSALDAAHTPTFGTPTPTATGFTVDVTNYDPAWTWTPSVSGGATVTAGAASGSTLPLTVTGMSLGQSATVTVATTRTGYADGSATLAGSSLQVGRTPTFTAVSASTTGFVVNVTNWDASWTWTPSVDNGAVAAGTPSGSTLTLTVTGLTVGQSATVTVDTSRAGYADGTGTFSGGALPAGVTATFDTPVPTADGFTVNVTNYDATSTWVPTVDSGTVAAGTPSGSTLPLTVTGLSPASSATVTMTTSKTGFADMSATVSGTSLLAALAPTFGTPVPTATGFTVDVTNWDAAWTWTPGVTGGYPVTAGTGSGSTLTLTVTGMAVSQSATVTVVTTRTGYADGSDTVVGSSLVAARTPAFDTPLASTTGFTVNVTNWDVAWTWTPSVTGGYTVTAGTPANGKLPLTVTGMTPGQTTTLTVDATRAGYVDGTSALTAGALPAGLDPVFGTPTPTATGFTVGVTNYDATYIWTPSVDNGTVTAGTPSGSTLPLTVTGLTLGQSATVTVVTTKPGVAAGTDTVTGSTLTPGLVATFGTPTPTATGFTIDVTNYDATWTWTYAVDSGTVTAGTPSGATMPLTITGIAAGSTATVTVTTSKATYADASATESGTTLPIGTVPSFGPTITRTATGFTVEIANYDPTATGITWNVSVTPGTATFDPLTGTVTVTGIPAGSSATLTVTTQEAGKADTDATVTGQALPAAGSSGSSGGSGGSTSGGTPTTPAKKPAAPSNANASTDASTGASTGPQPVLVADGGLPRVRPGGIVVTVGGQSVGAISAAGPNGGRCDGTTSGTQVVASVRDDSLQLVCGAPAAASWATSFRSVAPDGQSVPVVVDPFTTAGLSPLLVVHGGTIRMQGTGMKPGADVNLFVFTASSNGTSAGSSASRSLAKPLWIGRLVADGSGAVDGTLPIPAAITADDYLLQLVTADRSDRQVAVTMPVLVRDAAPTTRVVSTRKQVAFAAGSAVLGPKAKARLSLLAAQLRAGKASGATARVHIRGYAAPGTGTTLTSRRIAAVRGHLVRAGVTATITTQALRARPGGIKPGRVVTTATLTASVTTPTTTG